MDRISTDDHATTRATWDVVLSYMVQCADRPMPDRVVASFMHYRDCYVFMQGIAVADGNKFNTISLRAFSYLTRNGHEKYTIVVRDVYIGKATHDANEQHQHIKE